MKIFSGATALVLCFSIAFAYGENKADQGSKAGSPGEQSEQQPSSSVTKDKQTVQQVQQALNDKGYNAGQADGNWSSRSKDAMSKFQKDSGLKPTGQIDQQTLTLLGVSSAAGSSAAGGQQGSQSGSSEKNKSSSGGYGMMGNESGSRGQSNP